jgi:hypothetical protein
MLWGGRSLLCEILEMRVEAISFLGDYVAINVKEKTCKYLYDAKI